MSNKHAQNMTNVQVVSVSSLFFSFYKRICEGSKKGNQQFIVTAKSCWSYAKSTWKIAGALLNTKYENP